jgi:phosphoribosylamine--glycine ligase
MNFLNLDSMRILLLGSGGREHALAWKINQSASANLLYIAPGNAGTAQCGKNISIDITDFDAVGKFCISEKIEMIIVGPEEPLVRGLYDHFKSNKELEQIYFIGPSKNGPS